MEGPITPAPRDDTTTPLAKEEGTMTPRKSVKTECPDARFDYLQRGTLGTCAALAFVMGWLDVIMPSLVSRAEAHPLGIGKKPNFKKKYVVVIPKSGHVPNTFSEADPDIHTSPAYVELTMDVAGVPNRPYKTYVHTVTDPDNTKEDIYFMGEFPSAVRTNKFIIDSPRICTTLHQSDENEAFVAALESCLSKMPYGDIVVPIVWDDEATPAPLLGSLIVKALKEREEL